MDQSIKQVHFRYNCCIWVSKNFQFMLSSSHQPECFSNKSTIFHQPLPLAISRLGQCFLNLLSCYQTVMHNVHSNEMCMQVPGDCRISTQMPYFTYLQPHEPAHSCFCVCLFVYLVVIGEKQTNKQQRQKPTSQMS